MVKLSFAQSRLKDADRRAHARNSSRPEPFFRSKREAIARPPARRPRAASGTPLGDPGYEDTGFGLASRLKDHSPPHLPTALPQWLRGFVPFPRLRASVGFRPNFPILPAQTRRAPEAPQAVRPGGALPCPMNTLLSLTGPFLIYQKVYALHKTLLNGKIMLLQSCRVPNDNSFCPAVFLLIFGAEPCHT